MMKKAMMFAVLAGLFSTSLAGLAPWEDPSVNAINRLPARGISIPCEDEQLAYDIKQGMEKSSRWILPLNGTWDFKWKSATAVADWEKTAKISVPSCWQLQGDYDPPLYVSRAPIVKDAPRVTKAPEDKTWTAYKYRNPVGLYTTTFTRPWRWWFRRTILHFNGVSSAFFVRVNGKDVGYSEDSRLPAEFDVTPYLNVFGKNTLEVEVHKHCDGIYLEDMDFWRLSGIFRDVYLVSEHPKAPFDLVVETKLSEDLTSGKFIVRDEKGNIREEGDVPEVKLWSCESPFVYKTSIKHKWGVWSSCPWKGWPFGGIDHRAVTFGFRRVEIKNSILYLNGKRLLIKGVNRHEMESAAGYTVTKANMERDISIFKAFNINAVRTSHYPNDPRWYDLCDREGILVCCEANNESHGYGYEKDSLAKRADYRQSFVERGTRMVQTYRNHPSIIYWSMGNECGDGDNFTVLKKAMLAIDSTRPIHYERALNGDNTDIFSLMYSTPSNVVKYVANKPKKPYILCEYTHSMGNSTGGLQEYWDLVKKYPSFQGGFIWDFKDQALWKTDARGKWLAFGGDFGDKPNLDNFCCNGIFDSLRNPHPGAFEVKHTYQNVNCTAFDFATGKVKIRNDFLFRPLEDYRCIWRALNADGSFASKGEFELNEVAPGQVVEVGLEGFHGDSVVFEIHKDDCVAWDSFSKPFAAKKINTTSQTFQTSHPFSLNFWRVPTDNDRGWQMPDVCKLWKTATQTQKLPEGVKSDLKVSKLNDGSTLVDWTLVVPKGLPPLPRAGLSFTLPKTNEVEYFGFGPWENYSDRATAAILGVYRASVGLVSGLADPKTGTINYPKNRLNPDNYIEPSEQGYRTGCRRLTIGKSVIEAVDAPFGFNVWPYSQTMLEGKKHQWEIVEDDKLTVNIDAAQMGVGGDDTWGTRPHAPYMLGAGTYRLVFTIK